MPLATAVWLVDNTSISFAQISQFCQLHELEIQSIADGEEAYNMKGLDQLHVTVTKDEIKRCEDDSNAELDLQTHKSQNIHIRSNTKNTTSFC